jgi:hypothetical protein
MIRVIAFVGFKRVHESEVGHHLIQLNVGCFQGILQSHFPRNDFVFFQIRDVLIDRKRSAQTVLTIGESG